MLDCPSRWRDGRRHGWDWRRLAPFWGWLDAASRPLPPQQDAAFLPDASVAEAPANPSADGSPNAGDLGGQSDGPADVPTTGAGGTSGTGGAAGAAGAGGVGGSCVSQTPEMFVVLDRSASMADTVDGQIATPADTSKWTLVTGALNQLLATSGGSFNWGLKAFPEDGAECAASTVTSRIDVAVASGNVPAIRAAIAALSPSGNGTC